MSASPDRPRTATSPGWTSPVWTIDRRAHDWFTTSSGDANPIHADPVAARRLLGGRMLVHGANLLLRTLDQVAGAGLITAVPERIAVVFRAGVAPDDPLVTRATHRDDATLAITVADGTALERTVATIDVVAGVGGRPSPFVGARQLATDRPTIARALDLLDLAGEVGRDQPAFVPEIDPAQLEAHFPALVALLGARPVASIAAISCVIGMLTPGRSSMSSAYDIRDLAGVHTDDTTHDTTHGTTDTGDVRVRHTLDHVDLRLRRVRLTVRGPGCTAAVTAFVPPEPVDQATVLAGAPPPRPREFAGWRVLVVGGSRGLGEVAVRLLAAGGADVRFTWCAGAADAARVAGATGARAERWCAPDDEIEHLVAFAAEPTHVCWFASPPWPADPTATDVEITAFAHAVAAFAAHGLVGALWPSTDLLDVAPDDRPLGSDAWADRKAAGEAVCGRLAGAHPGLGVRIARLPILLTDRTRTLLPREYGDTADELLAALRQLPPAAP